MIMKRLPQIFFDKLDSDRYLLFTVPYINIYVTAEVNISTRKSTNNVNVSRFFFQSVDRVSPVPVNASMSPAVGHDELPDLEEEVIVDSNDASKKIIQEDLGDFRRIKEYPWYKYKSDMKRFLKYFNTLLFDGQLPVTDSFKKISVALRQRKYERVGCCGKTYFTGGKSSQLIGISVDHRRCDKANLAADEVGTLLYECIHAYLWVIGDNDRRAHGPTFMACV